MDEKINSSEAVSLKCTKTGREKVDLSLNFKPLMNGI
jgi:hypothetical protein